MAFRLDKEIIRGEIDNTLRGCTTGKIWLLDRDEPLTLLLEGDCWRDIAGSKLTFTNREPAQPSEDNSLLDNTQQGIVGDISASRKVRVPTIPEEDWDQYYIQRKEIPTEWKNSLYIEWFSEINGRVLIESTDFELELESHSWQMDKDEEEAQKLANLQGMRDFTAAIIRRRPSNLNKNKDVDEYEWEQRLQESDRLSEAYSEVLEKYLDEEHSEQKEAFVMGWDGLLDAMAHEDESPEESFFEEEENSDWQDTASEMHLDLGQALETQEESHPVQKQAQELAISLVEWLSKLPHNPKSNELTALMIQIPSKLSAACDSLNDREISQNGYFLAILKRCTAWSLDAIKHLESIGSHLNDKALHQDYLQLRERIFHLRDTLIDLRRIYRPK